MKAPTSKTSFGTTYKNRVNVGGRQVTHVYVYHSRSYYDSSSFLALDLALRLGDPYYYGNWNNPYSPWYQHPVYISASCQSNQPAPPANEKPDQAPVNVVVNNVVETTTTSSPGVTVSSTSTSSP